MSAVIFESGRRALAERRPTIGVSSLPSVISGHLRILRWSVVIFEALPDADTKIFESSREHACFFVPRRMAVRPLSRLIVQTLRALAVIFEPSRLGGCLVIFGCSVGLSGVGGHLQLLSSLISHPFFEKLSHLDQIELSPSRPKFFSVVFSFFCVPPEAKVQARPKICVTVCGFEKGKAEVVKSLKGRKPPLEVHVCDLLTEKDRAFSEESSLFMNADERARARDVAYRIGLALKPDSPLGYKDSQSFVVFDDSCPNNSLPILSEKGKNWTPLFPRF